MSNYADKLRKYARKLSNTDDNNKRTTYNRKMKFYRHMMGGAEGDTAVVDQQLQTQSNNIAQMLADVESQMTNTRSTLQQKIGSLGERINYAQNSFDQLQNHSRQLCAQVKQLSQEAAAQKDVTDQLRQKEAEITSLQAQLANNGGDKAQIEKLNGDLATVQAQLDTATAQNDDLNKQLGTRSAEILALQTQLAQQPQTSPETQKTIDELTAAKAEADRIIADQTNQINQYQKGVESIASILQELNNDNAKIDSLLDIKKFTAELCGVENQPEQTPAEQAGGKRKRKRSKY